jgi:hypothetical protein
MEAAGGVQPLSEFYQLRSSGRRYKALKEFGFYGDEGLGGYGEEKAHEEEAHAGD